MRLMSLTGVWAPIPAGGSASGSSWRRLSEWQRKSELSADRAGLLATQDPATAFRVHMKLASGSGDLSELDQTSFFAQGQEYLDSADLRDSVLKLLLIERATHPYAVVRAAELRRWVDSGEYTQILSGNYPRRDEDDARQDVRRGQGGGGQLHRDLPADPGRPRASSSTTWPVSSAAPSSGSTSSCAATATEGVAATGTERGAPSPGCGGQCGRLRQRRGSLDASRRAPRGTGGHCGSSPAQDRPWPGPSGRQRRTARGSSRRGKARCRPRGT